MKQIEQGNILALDVGTVRIGVAFANGVARLPRPLITLNNNDAVWERLATIVKDEAIGTIIVGVPRNLRHEDTDQTRFTLDFVGQLKKVFDGEIIVQDEALTSVAAETELKAKGKPYTKADVDALAATYILNDYLEVV